MTDKKEDLEKYNSAFVSACGGAVAPDSPALARFAQGISDDIRGRGLYSPRFGGCLRDLRIRAALTLRDFCRATNIEVTRVCELESHRTRRLPSHDEIEAVSRLYQLSSGDKDILYGLAQKYVADNDAIRHNDEITAALRSGKTPEQMLVDHGILVCKTGCCDGDVDEPADVFSIKPMESVEAGVIKLQTGKASIELHPSGDILVNGRLAATDVEVVEGMRQLLSYGRNGETL